MLPLVSLLILFSCIEREEYTYTYVVEGVVKNIVNIPLEGIEVIMLKTYSSSLEADTAYTDPEGKYLVSLTRSSPQRVFVVGYSDPNIKYKDTLRQFYFEIPREKTELHQQFKVSDTMILPSRSPINPF
jgi:ATP-dependent DNA ligase